VSEVLQPGNKKNLIITTTNTSLEKNGAMSSHFEVLFCEVAMLKTTWGACCQNIA
jgi:hypothetical protein